jgi:hypothetical protein
LVNVESFVMYPPEKIIIEASNPETEVELPSTIKELVVLLELREFCLRVDKFLEESQKARDAFSGKF